MRRIYYNKPTEWLELSVDDTPQANLQIGTISGLPYFVDWGDGVVETYTSLQTITKVYSSNFTGIVRIATPFGVTDISRFESIGSTAWNFDLGVFVPLTGLDYLQLYNLPNANITGSLNSFSGTTGLTFFRLYNLPNANITGSLNSFTGATGLDYFHLFNLPNANIDGSLNSFLGATGLTQFYLYNIPNANIDGSINSFSSATGLINLYLYNLPNSNITGGSSAFSNKNDLRDFLLLTSPTSNITMDYDDMLNIWRSSVYIIHIDSGISASKPTTSPFNFDSLRTSTLYFQNIGLSSQSMDNMIIALDNSLIAQSSPKTIYLDGNAPHSASPAVITALSNLANKDITVVL